jgi:uncharacterized protein (DUF58 family)
VNDRVTDAGPPSRSLRILPGRRLAWALGLCAPLLVLPEPWPWVAGVFDVALLALALWDCAALRRCLPELHREVPERMVLGPDNRVCVQVRNRSDRVLRGRFRDDAPDTFVCAPAEQAFTLSAHSAASLVYTAEIARRGQYRFGSLHLRIEGRLGLGSLLLTQAGETDVRVYPSPHGPTRYKLAQRRGALARLGIRAVRRAGGGELDRLREYVAGDALRDLSWKASAKRLRPITRVHELQQSQTLVIVLDAGRLMAAQLGALRKLDHAIHAALLLAWVALRGGDRVGLVVLEREVLRFVPPAYGPAQYRRILDSVYAVEAGEAYADFRVLTRFVRQRVPRRSLLLLFSDLWDESQALPLAAELPRLRPKHRALCVTFSDAATASLAQAPAAGSEQVYVRAAAADLVAERSLMKRHLARAGVPVLEVTAAAMSVEAVNRYLAIKGEGTL